MWDIKQYQQQTQVILKDWRVLTTEKSPEIVYARINEHSHIMIDWEVVSKFFIDNVRVVALDDLEQLINSQTKEIQQQMRAKRAWLKNEMWKEMTLDYAKNYLSKLIN